MARFTDIDDGHKQPSLHEQERHAELLYHEAVRRIVRLPREPGRRLLLGLLLELERIHRLKLTPAQRFDLLHPLKRLARRVTPQLPKPAPNASVPVSSLTLEQRLMQLLAINLKCLMRDLDRPRYLNQHEWDERRHWAQTNLMAFLARQVSYSAATGRPVPAGTWQELHDLIVYLVVRTGLRLQQRGARRRPGENPSFEFAYKRLLLLGLTLSASPTQTVPADLKRRVAGWALDAWLLEPDRFLGHEGLILVEVAKDSPPRWEPATLDDPFRGWVLTAPKTFVDELAQLSAPSLRDRRMADRTSSMAA